MPRDSALSLPRSATRRPARSSGTPDLARSVREPMTMCLRVTAEAAALIGLLTRESDDVQGLRIDVRAESDSLLMSLAATPESEDTVIAEQGVLVFLGPVAAERLSRQTLHASTADERSAFFLS